MLAGDYRLSQITSGFRMQCQQLSGGIQRRQQKPTKKKSNQTPNLGSAQNFHQKILTSP